jgi:hypothetical protein
VAFSLCTPDLDPLDAHAATMMQQVSNMNRLNAVMIISVLFRTPSAGCVPWVAPAGGTDSMLQTSTGMADSNPAFHHPRVSP